MDINELRPHIQSRIAHEFGTNFLDGLVFSIKNRLLEKDAFVQEIYFSPELAQQESSKYEPGLLMDALLATANESGHNAVVRDTKPKGHQFVQMTTPSCHVVITRKDSLNTKNAKFYLEQSRSNIGLVKNHQSDLLIKAILNEDVELDDLLFVCVTGYWNSDFELLDLDFIIPHPIENRPILQFSLAELKKSASEPMTDVAEEPILAIKKRLEQADDGSRASGE
ncbi:MULTISPECIES: hypothetical protein [Acinetobacter]|uniref:hypothetical protein n=1 Tax=Acinetobacter calcoaceticus TaxID=471 RepID=UPI00124C3394|nr:hypothetical protein [Acinetobacter calcoaceticus]